ncbi:hypothetical protein [Limosilactobacillus fermentum]|uniref:hypothetical protein n=1 Tax=Limosilactobacillus fermentum TaxID=1613 RepID=UPI00209AC766|nr:hypothetical protein [Limosilactobacillus fermentum]
MIFLQTANLLIATLLLIAGIIVIYLGVFAKEIEHPTSTNRLFQRLSGLGIKASMRPALIVTGVVLVGASLYIFGGI